jgi:hypothetical protein
MQKDGSLVSADPDGKQQHVVETLGIIDVGTSILLVKNISLKAVLFALVSHYM